MFVTRSCHSILAPRPALAYQKNPILSAFFREIDRADELGSGMRKMMLYGKKYGGADPQLIEGDNFRMIISVPEFGENPAKPVRIVPASQVTAQVEAQVGAQVGLARWQIVILAQCSLAERTGKDLMDAAGYRSRTGNFKKGRQQLVDNRLMELTIPDKPRSRLQKYRLTAKGRALLAETGKGTEQKER